MKEINPFKEGLKLHYNKEQLSKLSQAKIGIAGAGGLGSNIAMLLARSGIEKFIVIDKDKIEHSNLNRQHYWPHQIGHAKVHALKEHLLSLNPNIEFEAKEIEVNNENLLGLLNSSLIWAEAFDDNFLKKQFVETALLNNRIVVAASGIAGYGGSPLQKKVMGNVTIIGDFKTGIDQSPPLAPKVMQAAALMADRIIELILN